jgi:hypothetical protein
MCLGRVNKVVVHQCEQCLIQASQVIDGEKSELLHIETSQLSCGVPI